MIDTGFVEFENDRGVRLVVIGRPKPSAAEGLPFLEVYCFSIQLFLFLLIGNMIAKVAKNFDTNKLFVAFL